MLWSFCGPPDPRRSVETDLSHPREDEDYMKTLDFIPSDGEETDMFEKIRLIPY